MFKRAAANLNLSPAERAFLRFIEGLILSALIAGLQAVMPLLNAAQLDPAAIPWASVAHTFIATVLGAIGAAGVKYAKAQGDPALPQPQSSPAVPTAVAAPAASTVPPIVGAQQA